MAQPHHRLRVLIAPRLKAAVIDFAGLYFLQDAVDRQFVPVELIDVILELRLAGELSLDFDAGSQRCAQLVERNDVEDLRGRNAELALLGVVSDREQTMTPREILRYHFQRFGVGDYLREVDRFLAD